ncbi:discoidin domain-containing protein [Streptoalloteichus hindustanus]|uniref:F5/8 type C domain-containing protein n=1 Tax=Streptoalloteichus hindustanus TaxID=2017 RepID=A0A1M5M6S9_STRHI|nr:discoidin domain-containing protein [Streptoalloteichus hindustanus]SHG72950.1 F5/8 type C domain-containing protein [Streptoalloteichus hindustanus]
MSDTDLVVPIQVHALAVNRKIRRYGEFLRWSPQFFLMLDEDVRAGAEPPPYQNLEDTENSPSFEGVHVQWQLPEALTTGFFHPDTGDSEFPLVPNRWLVVRYCELDGQRRAAGWVVQSDYLQNGDHGLDVPGSTTCLDPYASTPTLNRIGRAWDLSRGRWTEPRSGPLFLTAVGTGLPAFAAFAPYHKDVFLFHDTLEDLKPHQYADPPDTVLSYAVIGWYSDDEADILRTAHRIPGLVPGDGEGLDGVLSALGWAAPDDMPNTITHTRYCGCVYGIGWEADCQHDPPCSHLDSHHPDGEKIQVAVGHSTAEAAAALVAQQTRSTRSADLVRALFADALDQLDTADGDLDLDEITHRSWFSGREGGHVWRVVNRPLEGMDSQPPPPAQPEWVHELNGDQRAYDRLAPRLAHDQWRLWTLWWLRQLPPSHRPHDFTLDPAAWQAEIDRLSAAVRDQTTEVAEILARIPHAMDPEALQAEIDEYAHRKGLPETLELKRVPADTYHRPADPVVVLGNTGNTDALTRDEEDPLPCRVPSALLSEVRIGDSWHPPESAPPLPNLEGLPALCTPLLKEFALLDRAVRAPLDGSDDRTALHAIVEDPTNLSRGAWPEHTRCWTQPWLPLYLQWRVLHCATPYQDAQSQHWTFDGDRYRWNGTGAEPGGGDGNLRWTQFEGRSFLTPALKYVLREQIRRRLPTAPSDLVTALRALRDDLSEVDILSQCLDGFGDWLLQHDGTAQTTTDPGVLDLVGQTNHVPDGAGDRRQRRFQPVRAGQFVFVELHLVDRFGQVARMVTAHQAQPAQFAPIRTDSVTPDHLLYPNAPGPQRFLQLPPRLMHEARLRFDAVPEERGTPVAGWLLVNHLDQTLLVYAADGDPLGELRVVHTAEGTRATAWNALPHAPHRHPDDSDFQAAHPHVAAFASGVLGHPPSAFDALMTAIDTALDRIDETSPTEDTTPARLIGRPVALVRADLGLDLLGPPLADPSWDTALTPPEPDYPEHRWNVRLGQPDRLADGLIGYFAADDVDEPTRYETLYVADASADGGYLAPIGAGDTLRLPARPPDRLATHHVTLLVCPHTAVHATTDVLPVHHLAVAAEHTHGALARIRASFRLDPLLAPTRRDENVTVTTTLGHTEGHPPERVLDGDLSTHYLSAEHATSGDCVALDLGAERRVAGVHLAGGDPRGDHALGASCLESSLDGTDWTALTEQGPAVEINHHPAEPFAARHIRLRFTHDSDDRVAIRQITVLADPPEAGIVMPRPAPWHGVWTWAEPLATDPPRWTELPILAADDLHHPDDPIPVARSGYLQLHPASRNQPPAPEGERP